MIVCKQCGHQNEDNDTFCGSCGKFLEWTGERVVVSQPEPEPPPAQPAPEPQPSHLGLIDRVKHAVGIEEAQQSTPPPAVAEGGRPDSAVQTTTTPATASGATTSALPPPSPSPAPAPAPAYRSLPLTSPAPSSVPTGTASSGPSAPPPLASAAASASAQASAPLARPVSAAAPVASPEPVLAGVGAATQPSPPTAAPSSEPESQKPGYSEPVSKKPTYAAPPKTTRAPVHPLAPTRKAGPDDVYCGECGEVNDKSRHFCRRCGHSLDEAIAVHLPWYRRTYYFVFRRRTRQAGWRPRRVGAPNVMGFVWRIIRLAAAAVIAIAVIAFLVIPGFHSLVVDRATTAFTTVRKICCPRFDPVHPTGAIGSSSIPGHAASLAIDTFSNTYWAASPSQKVPVLKIVFPDKVDLSKIGFHSGASGTAPADDFLAQPRPRQVHLVFSNNTTKDLELRDEDPKVTKNAQFYTIDAKQVTFVEIFIMSTYPTSGPSPSSVAIAEVEFEAKD